MTYAVQIYTAGLAGGPLSAPNQTSWGAFKTKNPNAIMELEAVKTGDQVQITLPQNKEELEPYGPNGAYKNSGWTEWKEVRFYISGPIYINSSITYSPPGTGSGTVVRNLAGDLPDPSIPPFAGYQAQGPWEQSVQPHNGKKLSYGRILTVGDKDSVYIVAAYEVDIPMVYDPFPEGEEPPVIPPYTPPGIPGTGQGVGGL